MNPRYAAVAGRAGHRCEYCQAPEAVFNFPFEVEHIIPVSRGGPDEEGNLALSCRACNLRKASHLDGADSVNGVAVRLFNPRVDRWEDHFLANPDAGEIQGLTPVGRATLVRLEMNSDTQRGARQKWAILGLFP